MSDNQIKKTPITASVKGKGFFERWGGPQVESNRWFIGFVFACLIILMETYALQKMLPLKTVEPWIITVKDTGKVEGTPIASIRFEPDENAKRYFLKEWVTKVFTLDRFLTEKYLIDAYNLVRDQASDEFRQYIEVNQPLVALRTDPTLVQSVIIRSISFVQDQAALIRIRIETRTSKGVKTIDRLVTVHFSVIPPKTEQEIYLNPIGLYITHFAVSEDIN